MNNNVKSSTTPRAHRFDHVFGIAQNSSIKQQKTKTYLLLVAIFLLPYCLLNNCLAESNLHSAPDDVYLNKINFCRISPKTNNDYEPEEFATSNNLLRKAGQNPVFCGERIIVHGRVLDQNCVPVADAKIYAWQVGCEAKYPYKPLKNVVDPEMFAIKPGTTFVGHGTATTNNKGEFSFVTVYPKAVHGLGPHINVRVEHRAIGSLQTTLELYGKRVSRPLQNPELDQIAPAAEEANTAIYDFEIVMPGEGLKHY